MANNLVRGRFFGSENVTVFLSELLGTALLVFFGCSSCIFWPEYSPMSTLPVVLSFGLAVMISVQIFSCVSGCHINPAVTVAATIYNLISVKMAGLYITAQFLGAFLGYGLLMILTPLQILNNIDNKSLCVTKPNPMLNPFQAFGVEFIGTAVLIWICCGIWDPRNAKSHDSIPLRFGLAVTGIASVTCRFTGGSLNPARSFGPAVWTNDFESHYIYWIAPISGAVVASIIYKYVFRREVIETGSVCCEDKTLDNMAQRNAETVA